jgi:hypothetical protein
MFRSPSLSRFCNLSSLVFLSCQSATVHLRLRLCQCLHGFAIVLPALHQIPVVVRSPDLWLLFGFSVLLFRLRLRYYCYVLSVHPLFRRNLDLISITVYCYLGISFLVFNIRCPCSPTCSFVPSLGPFYRRSTLRSPFTSIDFRYPLSIAAPTVPQSLSGVSCTLSSRFSEGNWRTSWLLPPFILVRLLLLVSCSVQIDFVSFSSLRLRRHCHPLRYSLAWSSIDRRSFPPWFVLHRSPLSLPPPSPLVVLWIYVIAYLV